MFTDSEAPPAPSVLHKESEREKENPCIAIKVREEGSLAIWANANAVFHSATFSHTGSYSVLCTETTQRFSVRLFDDSPKNEKRGKPTRHGADIRLGNIGSNRAKGGRKENHENCFRIMQTAVLGNSVGEHCPIRLDVFMRRYLNIH